MHDSLLMTCAKPKPDWSDLPPSAKLVYKTLDYEGACTQKELVKETRLAARTVRYALNRLADKGVVEERIHFQDARQKVYSLVEG